MSELLSQLQQAKVTETMKRFGFKMEDIFPGIDGLKENPYRKHTWVVKENNGYLVVNAIPEKDDQDHLFWKSGTPMQEKFITIFFRFGSLISIMRYLQLQIRMTSILPPNASPGLVRSRR